MGIELPVLCSLWGAQGWEIMGEVCLELPPPNPRTQGAELACQVGHSAPEPLCGLLLLTFSYFSKHAAEYFPGHKKYTMRSYHI